MNIHKQHIMSLLGLATIPTKQKVKNSYAKEEFVTITTNGVFYTDINIKAVYQKKTKGLFNTTYTLTQLKVYQKEVIYFGYVVDSEPPYEVVLEDFTDIPNNTCKGLKLSYISDIIPTMIQEV